MKEHWGRLYIITRSGSLGCYCSQSAFVKNKPFFVRNYLRFLSQLQLKRNIAEHSRTLVLTCGMFLPSKRSGVWKISSSGTPYFLRAFWKLEMFSMRKKAAPVVLNFGMAPGLILFISWHRTTPFFRT